MRSLFQRILKAFTGPRVAGAAKLSTKPVIHTDVYDIYPDNGHGGGWFFSWHDEKHKDGELYGPYEDRASAVFMRSTFVYKKENQGYLVIQEGR